jgi:hypothetical protein
MPPWRHWRRPTGSRMPGFSVRLLRGGPNDGHGRAGRDRLVLILSIRASEQFFALDVPDRCRHRRRDLLRIEGREDGVICRRGSDQCGRNPGRRFGPLGNRSPRGSVTVREEDWLLRAAPTGAAAAAVRLSDPDRWALTAVLDLVGHHACRARACARRWMPSMHLRIIGKSHGSTRSRLNRIAGFVHW